MTGEVLVDEQRIELVRRLNDVRDASIALRDAQRAAAEAAAEVRRTTHAARLAGQRANALLVTIRGEL